MELKFIEYGSAAYAAAAQLRYQLFYQPHGIDEAIVWTGEDAQDCHLVIEQDGQVLAYGRLTQRGNQFTIHQMVVKPSWQRKGLGRSVLRALVNRAKQQGGQSVSLSARVTKIGFYERQGFKSVGKIFNSPTTGIPHIRMKKTLELYSQE